MPGYGHCFWTDRTAANRRKHHPAFRGEQRAEVVVIGGGLVGCATAYALAAGGLDVVLVEQGRLADGGTAAGLGVIAPEPDATFSKIERTLGKRTARAAWNETRRSALELASTLKRLPVRCDLQPSSLIVNTRSAADAVLLRRDQARRKDAGILAPWLNGAAAARDILSESAGALHLRPAFEYDPVRAALGLAGAAAARGARIFERSPAVRTKFTRKDATVVLKTGTIRTRWVVVATGEPGAVFGQLRRHVRTFDGFAVATHSLPAPMRREVGARGSLVTEAGETPHFMRWLSEDRLLFAGALSRPVPARQRDKVLVPRTAQLMYELSLRYPAISGLPAAWGWRVPVVTTLDGLPWIGPHRNYPHHFFALALRWHGDGLAWFAARAALRHFRGESRKEDDVFGFLRG